MEILTALSAIVGQVQNEPACLYVILGINILLIGIEKASFISNRFIPLACIVVGPVAYCFLASRGSVPPSFPYPVAVLIINGMISGLISWGIHAKFTVWLLEKFGMVEKPEEKKP